jgi:hypothetical protein
VQDGWEFCVRYWTCIVEWKRYAISLEKAASIQLQMVSWMEELFLCLQLEGAKMIMLRCRRSPQRGVVTLMLLQLVVDMTIAQMMAAWRLQKADLL